VKPPQNTLKKSPRKNHDKQSSETPHEFGETGPFPGKPEKNAANQKGIPGQRDQKKNLRKQPRQGNATGEICQRGLDLPRLRDS